MTPIPFFDPRIAIIPHSASESRYLGRRVTVEQFSDGAPAGLYEVGNGDLAVETSRDGGKTVVFIQGPETVGTAL